jgi:hypothetical protein
MKLYEINIVSSTKHDTLAIGNSSPKRIISQSPNARSTSQSNQIKSNYINGTPSHYFTFYRHTNKQIKLVPPKWNKINTHPPTDMLPK